VYEAIQVGRVGTKQQSPMQARTWVVNATSVQGKPTFLPEGDLLASRKATLLVKADLLPYIWKIKVELKEKERCEINLLLQGIAYPVQTEPKKAFIDAICAVNQASFLLCDNQ